MEREKDVKTRMRIPVRRAAATPVSPRVRQGDLLQERGTMIAELIRSLNPEKMPRGVESTVRRMV